MRYLVVGDPHIRAEDLAEAQRLVDFIGSEAERVSAERIVLMGDLFHNFDLVHVEVMHFWMNAVRDWRRPTIILLGNHDGPHDATQGVHALKPLASPTNSFVQVVDKPTEFDGCLFLPFYRDSDEFVKACQASQAPVVFCHGDFDGAMFDNGSYSPSGVKPDAIPQTTVISGHFHCHQSFGKVWYVGSPRWLTASDANVDKFIWSVDVVDGKVTAREAIPTDTVCTKLLKWEDREIAPLDPNEPTGNAKVMVDIYGTQAWVDARKVVWRGKARVRTFPTAERRAQVRESDGIDKALSKYLAAYQPKFGGKPESIQQLVKLRLNLNT